MANRQEDRNVPAQQGNERSERGAGFDDRGRSEEEIRGVGDDADEEFEDAEDVDEGEEEETDEGSF